MRKFFYTIMIMVMTLPVKAHELEIKTGKIFSSGYVERYSTVPVYTNGSGVRTLMYINNLNMPVVGEIWDIEYEIHVTNDDLRARGKGVAATTEIRIGVDTSHNRSGFFACSRANGSFNVGVEAHHGLISRRCLFKWTQSDIDKLNNVNPVIKAYLWASSTAAQSGDRLKVDQGRGKLVLLKHIPN